MNHREQPTLSAGALRQQPTLPSISAAAAPQPESNAEKRPGSYVGHYRILCRLCDGRESVLYRASGPDGSSCILKLYHRVERRDAAAAYERLKTLACPYLPFLDWGREGDAIYECLQPVSGRPLSELAPLPEPVLRQQILPKLISALQALHENGLLHNDIKPENLLWNAEKESFWLVDFGSLTEAEPRLERGLGATLAYAAPEILSSRGRAWSAESDLCALGLTLYTLATGQLLIRAQNLMQAKCFWQQERQLPREMPFRDLIRELTAVNKEQRPTLKKLAQQLGIAAPAAPKPAAAPAQTVLRTVRFRNGSELRDLTDLLQAACTDWDFTRFLLQEHQLDLFLAQYVPDAAQLCNRCIRMYDPDAGLYCLLQSVYPMQEILWLGRLYKNDVALLRDAMESNLPLTETPLVRFCCAELLSFYYSSLQKMGYTEQAITYAKKIESIMKHDPQYALSQLQLALDVHPAFIYEGKTIHSVDDLSRLLWQAGDALDRCVDSLLRSEQFEAWMDYQGLEAVLENTNQFQEEMV